MAAQTMVTVNVKNEAGEPQVGVVVVLTARDTKNKTLAQAPLTAKTNKKGDANFPFLDYNAQGGGRFGFAVNKEGWFIKHIKIESRQPLTDSDRTGTSIQSEDSGFS